MFNPYIWSLYCNAPEGRRAINRAFPRYARFARGPGYENWRLQLDAEVPVFTSNPDVPDQAWESTDPVNLRELLSLWFEDETDLASGFKRLLIGDGLCYEWTETDADVPRCCVVFGGEEDALEVASNIGLISTVMHHIQPEAYAPYYFQGRFTLLASICHHFQIPLPTIPGKLQKRERALYYLAVNSALQEFRQRHGLSPAELNAFLYDFAPACLAEDTDDELPPPRRAWFVMAGVGTQHDFTLVDEANQKTESLWRGNRDARRGDIAVLWCASPRAYLHSIWRIVEDGHDDPFARWYSLVRIGKPMPVPHLRIKDLKNNPILAQSPLVRAHFQGSAGKYFSTGDYLALLELCAQHGADTKVLPHIPPSPQLGAGLDVINERSVETVLVEPLLSRLGFEEGRDWQRQVVVRMGRGEKVYPDYVIGFRDFPDQESAYIIVESKFRIATRKELLEAFRQGRSYALRLRATHLVLAALEGVWLISDSDGFALDSARHWDWHTITNTDAELDLQKLIAPSAIVDKARRS
ncbi:MAG: hypothetical protein LDL29_11635 [Dechloromonas sp.]|nr:hypothetical protein [Dechloromonas sp.]